LLIYNDIVSPSDIIDDDRLSLDSIIGSRYTLFNPTEWKERKEGSNIVLLFNMLVFKNLDKLRNTLIETDGDIN
jgi:hypothetical protein